MGGDRSSGAGVGAPRPARPPDPRGPCLLHCGDSVAGVKGETGPLLLLPSEPSPQARPPIASAGDAPFLRQRVQFCFDERPLIVGEVAGLQLLSEELGPLGEPPLPVDDSLRHGIRLCPLPGHTVLRAPSRSPRKLDHAPCWERQSGQDALHFRSASALRMTGGSANEPSRSSVSSAVR